MAELQKVDDWLSALLANLEPASRSRMMRQLAQELRRTLEQMAEQGKAWPLIEGSGTIYGMYVIEGLNQTKTEFFRDGMPRRIEFTLSLKRVDESLSDMFGDLSAQLNNLQDTATSALSDISKTVGGLLS